METVIVTGGSSGIGRALCAALAQRGFAVLAVARRASALQSLVEAFPGVIQAVVADVATPEGRDAVAAALGPDQPLRFLVHNAGTLEPIGPLTDPRAKFDRACARLPYSCNTVPSRHRHGAPRPRKHAGYARR